MKLKGEKQLTDYDIDKGWDLTREIFDIYTQSEEVKEMTDRLVEDLTLKEGYINGKPTTITIERIINEKRELV